MNSFYSRRHKHPGILAAGAVLLAVSCAKPPVVVGPKSAVKAEISIRADGIMLEQNKNGTATEINMADPAVVPGLKQALLGKKAGETVKAEFGPDKAFGPYNPGLVFNMPLASFPEGGSLAPGMLVQTRSDDGRPLTAMVVSVSSAAARIDLNHPLAGKTLSYEAKILEIRN